MTAGRRTIRRRPFPAPAIVLAAALAAAGCTTAKVLDPQTAAGPQASLPDAGPSTGPGAEPAAGQAQAVRDAAAPAAPTVAVSGARSIRLAPVIGAPADLLPPLARRLEARARQAGMTLSEGAGRPPLLMQGYFSAISDGARTTVVYVWDVLDASGKRLHRIQGRQEMPGGSGDGWSSVTPQVMEAIADATIGQLAAWLAAGDA